jgi:glycosyltransferase involved in cell wall biosynthesis
MPSDYESWGRVAVEAMACGIPVIAHPTPGLRESLSWAGTFADRNDPRLWVEAIANLDPKQAYISAREKSLARAKELDPLPQIANLEQFLHDIIHRKL